MTQEEIEGLNNPNNYKKHKSSINPWLNTIYKMMKEGLSDRIIYFYIKKQKEFHESDHKLSDYIYLIGKNNFPNRPIFHIGMIMKWELPPDTIVISRTELFKYISTCNPKTKKDKIIDKHIELIKKAYPAVDRIESMFKEFYLLLMGDDESKLDEYLEKYGESKISSFCNGIKKDIAAVKKAISLPINSGFVEGNNNKFKVIKGIVYGRSELVNLEKKCKLAFWSRQPDFSLSNLL